LRCARGLEGARWPERPKLVRRGPAAPSPGWLRVPTSCGCSASLLSDGATVSKVTGRHLGSYDENPVYGRVIPNACSNSAENLLREAMTLGGCSPSVFSIRSDVCGLRRTSSKAVSINDRLLLMSWRSW